jgi:hypothetical protein
VEGPDSSLILSVEAENKTSLIDAGEDKKKYGFYLASIYQKGIYEHVEPNFNEKRITSDTHLISEVAEKSGGAFELRQNVSGNSNSLCLHRFCGVPLTLIH